MNPADFLPLYRKLLENLRGLDGFSSPYLELETDIH
jgi:hypothetical protein